MPPKRIKFIVKKPKEEPTKPKKKIKFIVKDKEMPKPQKKRKIKFIVKPKPVETTTSELEKFGLTKEKANSLNVLELFGMLPVELRKNILTPESTGVQVAKEKFTVKDIMDLVRRFQVANKARAYSKISQRQNDIFEKYSDLDRIMMSSEEFKDKLEKMNRELGPPFMYGDNISYNTDKVMKNFKKDFESMFDRKLGRYDLSFGSAYALLQDVKVIQRFLDNPVSEGKKKFRKEFLKKFDEKFEKPKKEKDEKKITQRQTENEAKKILIKKYLEDQPKTKRYAKNSRYIEGPNNNWYYSYKNEYLIKNILDKSVEVEIKGGTSMSESDRDEIGKIKKIPLLTFASQVGIVNSDLVEYE